ncbi:MAG: UDP-3-O-(3-hydroxymyristoyl)glucosamine N-acyltransferase [Synergistaceae bacterium]|jgi:UDP-3-O-[3-hydroxymyristoyl] glucosamine N-acyltransferase|nr:UDP-3-O-(3-hydroxymyristoyl)glucosamine N-acyltransferase [Synergistaceae bacterium]
MPEITLEYAAKLVGGDAIGNGGRIIRGVCSPDDPRDDMLCAVWDKNILGAVPRNVPVISEQGTIFGRDGIELVNPRASLVKLLPLFAPRRRAVSGIHPSAYVDARGTLGHECAIGPNCVVSGGAVLGDRIVLQANVFIGENVSVGNDTVIEAAAAIQDFAEIGAGVIIHSGASIGCDGFGFVPGPGGGWEKIPQTGRVVIEDDVEIGPNCTIDRATFGATRIGRGTKIGACVHVAHNCDIGPDSMMVGFVAVGGSVKTGRGFLAGGMSAVADHVKIGDNVTVAGRAGVTRDVGDGLTVSGFPAREHSEEKRFQASLRRVRDYGERIKNLEKTAGGAG